MRAANDRERRGDTVLWETIRLQLGEERLAELCGRAIDIQVKSAPTSRPTER